MPNVTVIIPTLNRPAELTRAVLSVLNQTYRDLEVVVVADEPSEATLHALKDLANLRLRFLTNPRKVGLADARNIGVNNSSSNWVAFLDDDDEWLPDKIEKQLAVAETLTGDFIFVVSRYIERAGVGDRVWPEQLPAGTQRFSEYMYCRRGMLIPSSFFVSRSLITEMPFTSGLRYLEDIDWMLRVTSDARTQLGTVEAPLVIYNNFSTPGQLSYDISWQRYYSWAVGHRQFFTPIAFSLFITKTVVAKAREGKASWRELLHLLSAAMLLGAFSPRAFFFFLASCLFTRNTKRKVREFLSPAARQSRVMAPPES